MPIMRALPKPAAIVLTILGAVATGVPALAASDFQGKTITIFIGYGTGGSYYFYAQLLAHRFGKHLPGQPNVIVESNLGAGGVRMLNDAAVRMPADGTNLFIPPDTTVVIQLLQPQGLAYDAAKYRYIGTVDQENTFWVLKRSQDASIDGMRAHETFMGSSGKGSTGYMIPALAGPLLDLKIKPVAGYNSSQDMILAMEKGEIDGTLQAWQVWKQSRPDWFRPNGFGVPVLQIGAVADPDAPTTPLLRDIVSADKRPLASLFDTIGIMGRSLAAPPATAAEIVATLRQAFQDTLVDPDFIAEAKQSQLRILPRSGEELQAAIEDALSKVDVDVVKRGRELTQ
jgi:tripartite-type tricarboxylate transporter receptor subunit TctC